MWNQVELVLMSVQLSCAVDGRILRWRLCWERGFATLCNFRAREGHCCPSRRHVEGRFRLGQWVAVQRYFRDVLPVERKRRLDKIGFVWAWRDNHWEQNFAALLKFKRRQGHCCVPIAFKEGDLKLGWWVATQRRNRKEMSTERRARLNKIGFVWHAPRPYRPTGAPRPQSPISDHPSTSAESRV
jgi:Helicase associated domain